jgi:Protein of unknown function (DUF3558)
MRSMRIIGAAGLLAVTLTACNTSNPDPNPTQSAAPTTAAAAPTSTAAATGAPANLDPCQLVPQQEASALAGASFGPGQLEVENAASSRCVYGANTKNVFLVIVARAASVAEAQAQRDEMRSEAETELGGKLNVAKVTGVGDDAESITGSLTSIGVNVSGLYVLKGTLGFALVDEVQGGAAPTTQALIDETKKVLSGVS